MYRHAPLLLLSASLLLPACGRDEKDPPPGQDDTGPDTRDTDDTQDTDDTDDTQDTGETGLDTSGELPPVPEQHGVVYAAHYGTRDLYGYRIDGDHPRRVIELQLSSEAHDMAIDREQDLAVVVQDVARAVRIYQLDVPTGPADAIDDPSLLSTIDFSTAMMPVFAEVDPYHQRLYVAVASTQGTLEDMELRTYSLEDPGSPQRLDVSTIPVTTSWAVDPVRRVLFVVDMNADTLNLYDLKGDQVTPLEGAPIDLRALFPQENSTSFQARNLTVDPWHHRVYAARSQSALSELIAFEYPAVIPGGATGYGQLASHADLVVVEDWFDVDVELDDRSHLLDGFTPLPDPQSGAVMFVANAWNGTVSTSLVVPMSHGLEARTGCGDYEGIGCWFQSHYGGSAGSYQLTDGAACVDWTRGVMVGSSYDVYSATAPGMLHLFRFEALNNMEPWLEEDGGDPVAGGLPIALICH